MNPQLKTVLLTMLTLSVFAIALVELSGVSSTALFNKYGVGKGNSSGSEMMRSEEEQREKAAANMPKTVMEFADTKYSFGKIKEGAVVTHDYTFKNTGSSPLYIIRAAASCGCTVPSFPRQAIPPGGSGAITVQFSSKGREGHQQKNVLIYSNAQAEKISIGFDAEVE